jgi:hypothetical protein
MKTPPLPQERLLAALIVGLLIWLRIASLNNFAWVTTDLDQLLMWQAAREFAAGNFYEPAFWGQNYNTMIEGLLAAPLLLLGCDPGHATTVITVFLTVIPFLLLASIAWRNGRYVGALYCLSVPVLLPTRFALITSIPRGFMPGIAVAGLAAAISLLPPTRGRLLTFGALSTLAFAIMPNALPLVVASALFILVSAPKKLHCCGTMTLGALVGMAYPLYRWYFYTIAHPDYVMFPSVDTVSARVSSLVDAIPQANLFFDDVVPQLFQGSLGLPLWLLCMVPLCRGKRCLEALCALGATAVLTLGILFNPKVHNASISVFYSYSRFFLALPYVYALCLASSEISIQSRLKRHISHGIFALLVLLALSGHILFFRTQLATEMSYPNPVAATMTAPLRDLTDRIGQVHRRRRVTAWIFAELHRAPALAGAALLQKPFLGLLYNDRRRWLTKPSYDKVFSRIALFGFDTSVRTRAVELGFKVQDVTALPQTFVLIDVTVPLRQVLNILQIDLGARELGAR